MLRTTEKPYFRTKLEHVVTQQRTKKLLQDWPKSTKINNLGQKDYYLTRFRISDCENKVAAALGGDKSFAVFAF